ncbi:chromatin remodeling complex subunit Arp8 [Aulographum hederae CBS 113979]|uniref:Chromatin remodeling complex subunit Arp8 n=1 Tax=Aulographum hederae CBS 113979 TaxID=1176131 RepID=A0A6G1H2A1_9PEZI|nr:chromatin remodeling complex subunit Arp8 [Aulographum hederae CBS 113979]
MVGKKSGKALQREEGLARTDNNLDLTIWPQVNMINQKNYYTEYLKRDDQYLAYRTLQDENRNNMVKEFRDKDRALAGVEPNAAADDAAADEAANSLPEAHGSKIIVIHPGSQNLRIGLANDALPKSVPMCIAKQWRENESEEDGGEPKPKRVKIDNELPAEPEKWFGDEFATQYTGMSTELKQRMRLNKRRLMPNSKELVVNYNKKVYSETITEHNDPHRIDWTELPPDPRKAPMYFTGQAALRIPEKSKPRYKVFWPLRNGSWFNERDYTDKRTLWNDIILIIEDTIKSQLGLDRKKDWAQYSCVFIIPDLYERTYVTTVLDVLMREFGFRRACFMQESVAATFGAGYSCSCIVDIGAQKTSICCVDDGMCVEESRMNLKYGGADVTELFMKMMLYDHFPYEEINLKRRYDFLLAEELKWKHCTMSEGTITVLVDDFHLRAAGQDTRKYSFKFYDETMLAPMAYFKPEVFDHSNKLKRRRAIIDRSYDLYDGSPNDPTSHSQTAALQVSSTLLPPEPAPERNGTITSMTATPSRERPFNLLSRLNDPTIEATPRSSVAGSPAPEGTPQPIATNGRASPTPGNAMGGDITNANGVTVFASNDALAEKIALAETRDLILPVMALDAAILTSIHAGARGDDKKTRDFMGGIMVVGGGAKFPNFNAFLEERLKEMQPAFAKEILIGPPPRELDQQLVVWKGGSVFGRLSSSGNDSWVYGREYDVLGSKLLAQKCMWNW